MCAVPKNPLKMLNPLNVIKDPLGSLNPKNHLKIVKPGNVGDAVKASTKI